MNRRELSRFKVSFSWRLSANFAGLFLNPPCWPSAWFLFSFFWMFLFLYYLFIHFSKLISRPVFYKKSAMPQGLLSLSVFSQHLESWPARLRTPWLTADTVRDLWRRSELAVSWFPIPPLLLPRVPLTNRQINKLRKAKKKKATMDIAWLLFLEGGNDASKLNSFQNFLGLSPEGCGCAEHRVSTISLLQDPILQENVRLIF